MVNKSKKRGAGGVEKQRTYHSKQTGMEVKGTGATRGERR